MNQITDQPAPPAVTPGQLLAETRDYARRIHWWVRLLGIIMLTGMAISAVSTAYFIARAAQASANASRAAAYASCMQDNTKTLTDCTAILN
jgi:hypothetical protein